MNSLLRHRSQTVYAPGIVMGAGASGVDPGITSIAELAAISTISLTPPVLKVWVLESEGTSQIWRLLAGTSADYPGAIQRPNDYNGSTNAKVWFKAAS